MLLSGRWWVLEGSAVLVFGVEGEGDVAGRPGCTEEAAPMNSSEHEVLTHPTKCNVFEWCCV